MWFSLTFCAKDISGEKCHWERSKSVRSVYWVILNLWNTHKLSNTSGISWLSKNWEGWLGATLQLKSIVFNHTIPIIFLDVTLARPICHHSKDLWILMIQDLWKLKQTMEPLGKPTSSMNSFLLLLSIFSPTISTINKVWKKNISNILDLIAVNLKCKPKAQAKC